MEAKPERRRLEVWGTAEDANNARVVRLIFKNPITEADRETLLKAINAWNGDVADG